MRFISTLILSTCCLTAQQNGSSPFTFLNNKTTGNPGEFHIEHSDGHYFGFVGQPTAAGNIVVGSPNTAPTPGTCLGYVSALQTGWVACSGAGTLDPTLGVLMTSNTNTGVTGTGNGAHISWDPTNHWIDIQSWFSGSIAPVHINASQLQTQILNFSSCLGTGCFTNGFRINNLSGNNATDTTDGSHYYWDTSTHTTDIQSWFSGAIAPVIFNASYVQSTSFHGPLVGNADTATALFTLPTLCSSGQSARGIVSNGNATGCTVNVGDPTIGFNIVNSTGLNATGTVDGFHVYWDTSTHISNIQSWFSGGIAPISFNASHVDATSFHGNIFLTTIPSLCALGSYSRGVDQNINSTGCTVANLGTVTSVGLTSNYLAIGGINPVTSSGIIAANMPSVVTAGSCGSTFSLCSFSYNAFGIITTAGAVPAFDPSLGVLMTNNTNTGVTGTGDGMHLYFSTTNHWSEIDSWFSGSLAPLHLNISVLQVPTISLSTAPTLCSTGFAAQGVNALLNATGCTAVGGSAADPTLGLIGVNDTNTNTTGTTVGMHVYYDPGTAIGHIKVYNGVNTLQPLIIDLSTFTLNASGGATINSNIVGQSFNPSIDNFFTLGVSNFRFNDIRSADAHFGINPNSAVTGEVTHGVCASSTCFSVIDAFSGNAGVYWTRSAGGSNVSPSAVTSGSFLGVFGSSGFDGSSWVASTTAGMFTNATQTWSGGAHGTNIFFETTAIGSTTPAVRLTVDSNGLTVPAMASGANRAVCVTSVGVIYASLTLTCP